jgi:hypothetical protein
MADNKEKPLLVTVLTESGSVYEIDRSTMRWHRIVKSKESGPLFQQTGELKEWPEIKKGERMNLVSKSVHFGDAGTRVTSTSPVQVVIESECTCEDEDLDEGHFVTCPYILRPSVTAQLGI